MSFPSNSKRSCKNKRLLSTETETGFNKIIFLESQEEEAYVWIPEIAKYSTTLIGGREIMPESCIDSKVRSRQRLACDTK